MNKMGMQLGKLRDATKKAFDRTGSIAGGSTPSYGKAYSMLTEDDFGTLADAFGLDVVSDYIKHMEAERMTGDAD